MFRNMPWSSGDGEKKDQDKEEESLMSVLDDHDREEFTLLIASIMVVMRKTIESNFDATVRLPLGAIAEARAYLMCSGNP